MSDQNYTDKELEQAQAYHALTDMQRAYVDAYVSDDEKTRFNATQSAKQAGYAHPGVQGAQLKNVKKVRKAIKWRMRALIMEEEEVLLELRRLALEAPDDSRNKMEALKLMSKQWQRFSDKKELQGDININASEEDIDELLGYNAPNEDPDEDQ